MAMTAEERRRDALERLKQRAMGGAPRPASAKPPNGSAARPIDVDSPSPDAQRILVPASSSPVRSPALPGHSMSIPSSNLSRLVSPSKPAPPSQYSPSSPQVLSRLKKRTYDGDESPTRPPPAKASLSTKAIPTSRTALPAKAALPRKGPPKLVAVAQAQHDQGVENRIQRLLVQFPRADRASVHQAIERHKGHTEALMEDVQASHDRNVATERARNYSSSAAAQNVNRLKSYTFAPTPSVSSSASAAARPTSSASALPPTPSPVKKKRRNENSTIYAKRNEKSKSEASGRPKGESDEDSAAESGADSEDGSEAWSGDDKRARKKKRVVREDSDADEIDAEGAALRGFNTDSVETLTGTIACSEEQAKKIISLRPYEDTDDVAVKLRKARGVSYRLFEMYADIMEGYVQIDSCLNRCEAIADDIANTLAVWRGAATASTSVVGSPAPGSSGSQTPLPGLSDVKVDVARVNELLLSETNAHRRKILASYVRQQPALLSEGTTLKDYQLLGLNWLNMLYSRKIGCILADEMGLGKTIQVIAFLAHLKERGIRGPHLILVPASTLENWTREFARFAPGIDVDTYYGSQAERVELRAELKAKHRAGELEVVLASYTQVQSHDDLAFFRKKVAFETCVYDEAHMLKNFMSKRYQDLLSVRPRWRLLLTGTPVQNNLQELVSLLMFIHPGVFAEAEPHLRAIFKVAAGGAGGGAAAAGVSMLSQNRVSRARTMLTPFVLRRRKAHVLTLPPKTERTEACDMTPVQARLYRDTLMKSRKAITSLSEAAIEAAAEAGGDEDGAPKPKGKSKAAQAKDKAANSSSNILMELRKAASHPLLFRRLYTMPKLRAIARACLNTPTWCDSDFNFVVEDLSVMTDAEIHHFVSSHDELAHFALDEAEFLEGGKMRALLSHISRCKAEGRRLLVFSQFTMILDILQVALKREDVRYVRLDGQTRTDERQSIVDEFDEDEDITVFLLSTKAGGVGINLTAASCVVIFDQDFNPHNDRQAADRAYRIGQERPVEVIKLISRHSIDEDIAAIGQTKLQLDDMVGGAGAAGAAGGSGASGSATPSGTAGVEAATEGGVAGDDKTAAEVKKSLLKTLRSKFEEEGGADDGPEEGAKEEEDDGDEVMEVDAPASQPKRARGVAR